MVDNGGQGIRVLHSPPAPFRKRTEFSKWIILKVSPPEKTLSVSVLIMAVRALPLPPQEEIHSFETVHA